jgi:hypothetical protein
MLLHRCRAIESWSPIDLRYLVKPSKLASSNSAVVINGSQAKDVYANHLFQKILKTCRQTCHASSFSEPCDVQEKEKVDEQSRMVRVAFAQKAERYGTCDRHTRVAELQA